MVSRRVLGAVLLLSLAIPAASLPPPAVPLPEGEVDAHRESLVQELRHKRFGFIIGGERSGLLPIVGAVWLV